MIKLHIEDSDYARAMLEAQQKNEPWLYDKRMWIIERVEVVDNSEIAIIGGIWGHTPGIHHIPRPVTYIATLEEIV